MCRKACLHRHRAAFHGEMKQVQAGWQTPSFHLNEQWMGDGDYTACWGLAEFCLFCFSLLLYKLYVHFHFHIKFHFISACKTKAFISMPSNLESVCVLKCVDVCVSENVPLQSEMTFLEGGGGGGAGRGTSHGGRSFIFTCHGDS